LALAKSAGAEKADFRLKPLKSEKTYLESVNSAETLINRCASGLCLHIAARQILG
jgi:hypothetical protein